MFPEVRQNLVQLLLNANEDRIIVEVAVENSGGKRTRTDYMYSSHVSQLNGYLEAFLSKFPILST